MQVIEREVHVCIYTFAETGQIRVEYSLLVLVVSPSGNTSSVLVCTEICSQLGWWLNCFFFCNNLKFSTVAHSLSYSSDLLCSVVEKTERICRLITWNVNDFFCLMVSSMTSDD